MPRKVARGPARMRELGYKSVTIYMNAQDLATLDEARGYLPRATFLFAHGMEKAKEIVRQLRRAT